MIMVGVGGGVGGVTMMVGTGPSTLFTPPEPTRAEPQSYKSLATRVVYSSEC